MAYTLVVKFCSLSAAEEYEEKFLRELVQEMIVRREGIEMTIQISNSAHIYAVLVSMRHQSDINTIMVRDDDGWECEEIDLMDKKSIESLSDLISVDQSSAGCNHRDSHKLLRAPADEGNPFIEYKHNTEKRSDQSHPRLILASQSPRRKELLGLIGIPFTTLAADVDEESLTSTLTNQFSNEPFSIMAAMIVMNLARAKAQKILAADPDAVVIGSDTIVTIDSSILGKPSSSDAAFDMLRSLSGRDHHVFTGVSIVSCCKVDTFFTVTRVGFYPWSQSEEDLAHRYIDTGTPMDKAGAYGIQDMGALFIRGIKGDYYTVMGLPVSAVYNRLQDFGISMDPSEYI